MRLLRDSAEKTGEPIDQVKVKVEQKKISYLVFVYCFLGFLAVRMAYRAMVSRIGEWLTCALVEFSRWCFLSAMPSAARAATAVVRVAEGSSRGISSARVFGASQEPSVEGSKVSC